MIPEKTNQYKTELQQSITDEIPKHRKKSKTAKTSRSKKRSDHKHQYQKVILHCGSDSFMWGRQCEICGRVDSSYKASNWISNDFKIRGIYTGMSWNECCRREIRDYYPHHKIFVLCEDLEWREWNPNYPIPD